MMIFITNARREHGALFTVMRATTPALTPVWIRQRFCVWNKLNRDASTDKGEPKCSFHPCAGKTLLHKFGRLLNYFLIFTFRCNLTYFLTNTEATAHARVRSFCQVSAR